MSLDAMTRPTMSLPGEAGLPRLLPAEPVPATDLWRYQREAGPPRFRGAALIEQVAAAGLTGRGGAAFPVATKLSAVARRGPGTVVVGNAAEGEPASSKDSALLWHAPHLVLDGLQLAAEAVGARTAYLYLGNPQLTSDLYGALRSRAEAGREHATVQLVGAAPGFLSGEETALAAALNGKPARPADKSRRVFERGVDGRPTLVQNVETLAHLALVARYGAAWFRSVGTPEEPGSALCTVRGPDGRARVVEASLGTPLHRLLPLGDSVQAVLAGGYHGGWLTTAAARQLTFSNASLKPAGAFAGAGVLVALPADCCGLAETAAVARYLALESAGQCGPCWNGLPAMAGALAELAKPRPARQARADLLRWAGLVKGRGACHHPDGTARFITTALEVFAAEISAHETGRCTGSRSRRFLPLGGDLHG